jgi:hypothetical protein
VAPNFPVKTSYDKSLHVLHITYSPMIESSHTLINHAIILVKQIQPVQQNFHNNLQQARQDNFFSKENISPRFRFNKSFPDKFMHWRPFLPNGEGFIQVEIDGHQPIPLAQNRGFHLGIFSTYFWVLNFQVRFKALKNIFWAQHSHTIGSSQIMTT